MPPSPHPHTRRAARAAAATDIDDILVAMMTLAPRPPHHPRLFTRARAAALLQQRFPHAITSWQAHCWRLHHIDQHTPERIAGDLGARTRTVTTLITAFEANLTQAAREHLDNTLPIPTRNAFTPGRRVRHRYTLAELTVLDTVPGTRPTYRVQLAHPQGLRLTQRPQRLEPLPLDQVA